MLYARFLTFFAVLSISLQASAARLAEHHVLLTGDREIVSCVQMFLSATLPAETHKVGSADSPQQLEDEVDLIDVTEAEVGSYQMLFQTLFRSNPDVAEEVFAEIDKFITLGKDPVAALLRRSVDVDTPHGPNLFVAILKGESRSNTKIGKLIGPIPQEQSQSSSPYARARILLMDPLPLAKGTDRTEWLLAFFGHLTQFAVAELVQDWTHANLERITRNEEPDGWFRKYVTVNEGVPDYNRGFLKVLVTSLVCRVQWSYMSSLSKEEGERIKPSLIEVGLRQLTGVHPDVTAVIDRNNLEVEDKLLKIGAYWMIEIRKTLGEQP